VTDERDSVAGRGDSLVEVLDRLLHEGVVLCGDLAISVADVDLVYLRLQLVLSSVETARQVGWYRPLRCVSPAAAAGPEHPAPRAGRDRA